MVASTRTSSAVGSLAPSGSTSRSCNTRRSFACRPRSISEISSSSRVPPLACTNFPSLLVCAPVKAPFSYPNSNASSILSGMAAQLMATNGPSLRAEQLWMYRARTSFPVPLSPVNSTVTSLFATRAARDSRLWLLGSTAMGAASIFGAVPQST